MARNKTKRELLFGSKAKYTHFGMKGMSRGMYTGGFTFYVYGIKNIINFTVYTSFGDTWRK